MSIETLTFLVKITSKTICDIWANDAKDQESDEDDESDVFASVFGFSLTNDCSAAGTEMGELPEPGEAPHQQGGQPGAEHAAGDGEAPTWGGDLTGHIRHNLYINKVNWNIFLSKQGNSFSLLMKFWIARDKNKIVGFPNCFPRC